MDKENPARHLKSMKRWIPVLVLIVLIGTVYASGLHHLFSLDEIQGQKEVLQLFFVWSIFKPHKARP